MLVHSKPVVSHTEERGLRLHLLLKKSTEVFRGILFKLLSVNDKTIQAHLSQSAVHNTLTSLRKNRVLYQDQWLLLYPTDAQDFDVYKFDSTLICLLIRSLHTFPNVLDWNKLPNPLDNSLLANIIRLKFLRNLMAHKSLDTLRNDFDKIWSEFSDVLLPLGCKAEDIESLRTGPIDRSTHRTLTETQKALADEERKRSRLEKAYEGIWWNVQENVASFTGREDELQSIHDKITSKSKNVRGIVLYGLGGVGKTEMAIRYCHKYFE